MLLQGHKEFFEKVQKAGDFSCSFCGRLRKNVDKLISGPLVFICRDCVIRFHEVAAEPGQNLVNQCSFCGQSLAEVKFTAGDTQSGICVECLELCTKILGEEGMPVPDDIPGPPTR
jgi:ATP-dependent protease Clp ATPase subunit